MKKSLLVCLGLSLLLSISAFAVPYAVSVENPSELHTEAVTQEATASLAYSAYADAPGYNNFTGTTEKLDFEGLSSKPDYIKVITGGTMSIAKSFDEGTGDALAADIGGSGSKVALVQLSNSMEKGRKYHLGFKIRYIADKYAEPSYLQTRVYYNTWGQYDYIGSSICSQSAAQKWLDYSKDFVWDKDSPMLHIGGQNMQSMTNCVLYFDDIELYPYYNINYYDGDGNLIETESILYDTDGGIITGKNYSVDALGEKAMALSHFNDEGNYVMCIGWNTVSGADTVTNVKLCGEDVNLYPVFSTASNDIVTPETKPDSSIRGGSNCGIRFRAVVSAYQLSLAEEYGFIVTRKSMLPDGTELTHEFVSGDKKLYVEGKAFDKEGGINKIFSVDDDNNVTFTGVCIGLKPSAYKEVLVARPYIKYTSGSQTVIVYGDPVERSLYDVALAIKNSQNQTDYLANKEYIDSILEAQ